MLRLAIYSMIYLGSALMVFNIYGFVRFARRVRGMGNWERGKALLYVPIALLGMFLLGYLAVGIFGRPDLIVSGILFGGSVFVFCMFKLLQGISDRIQENEQIRAKLMATEASNQAKSSLLANMSHEMRTPMNAIIGLDAIALRDERIDEQTRERLEKIDASARHMMDLITNALDMNRIESGRLELKSEPFSMREMLELLDLLVSAECEEKGLEYAFEAEEGLEGTYISDELSLRRALLAILDNAVKFTPAPGKVSFSASQADAGEGRRALRFTIRDTGIGMDEAFIPSLFESFSREDASTTNLYSGSGLSLALAKRIVDLMGGTIEVETKKGAGSVFTVCVALEKVADADAQADAAATEPVNLHGRRVLIVEDIDLNAEIVADLLELEEVESERAHDGREALEMFTKNPPDHYDAILMDLRMPVMDGLDATRAIRALERADAKTVPIVALTANAYESDVRATFEVGMNAHLSKPADSQLLYETLGKVIENRR